jgi:hypothetical protein
MTVVAVVIEVVIEVVDEVLVALVVEVLGRFLQFLKPRKKELFSRFQPLYNRRFLEKNSNFFPEHPSFLKKMHYFSGLFHILKNNYFSLSTALLQLKL